MRKAICYILLVALLNSVFGCAGVKTFSAADVESGKVSKIEAVVTKCQVAGVTTAAQEDVRFDERGGVFNKLDGTIRGKTPGGREATVGLDEVQWVWTESHEPEGPTLDSLDSRTFEKIATRQQWCIIDSANYTAGKSLRFVGHDFGHYSSDARAIEGVIRGSGPISIPIENVLYIQTGFDESRSRLLHFVLVGAIALVIFVYVKNSVPSRYK